MESAIRKEGETEPASVEKPFTTPPRTMKEAISILPRGKSLQVMKMEQRGIPQIVPEIPTRADLEKRKRQVIPMEIDPVHEQETQNIEVSVF